MLSPNTKPVIIISHDIVGEQMAGPGIRYYQLAKVLGQTIPTILAMPSGSSLDAEGQFSTIPYKNGTDLDLQTAIESARAVLVPAIFLSTIPILLDTQIPIIIDGYDPYIAETLAFAKGDLQAMQVSLTQAYLKGDFFICASERQRDWWLGLLEANGRINPLNFQADASLRQLTDVVAYGHPEALPHHSKSVIKTIWPGIEAQDRLLLWGGGLWSWLDPLTAIRAVAKIYEQRQDVKLVFPGTKHPNPDVPESVNQNKAAKALAQDLGILDKAVFFGDWVPYDDWANVLLECDVALTLHNDTLETRLAFRSRALEYIWASLPIIATKGDAVSELVEKYELGMVVDYQDEADVVNAILTLLDQPRVHFETRFNQIRDKFSWDQVAQPLIRFCQSPTQAADKKMDAPFPGNAYYLNQISSLHTVISNYERGRFMRFMRWIKRITA
ncbi:MAG: glycosyltransferase family 4 protein [Chloroflexota bacterium]